MLTLYTAIGNYRLTEKGLPLVTAGGRDCALDAHELLLWSSLAFRILTYQELRAEFYEKERELHILGELDFDHYLNRLIMRRLVASGKDCTGVDALYDLLGHLYVQPAPNGITVKAISFLKLILSRRLPPPESPGGIPYREAGADGEAGPGTAAPRNAVHRGTDPVYGKGEDPRKGQRRPDGLPVPGGWQRL